MPLTEAMLEENDIQGLDMFSSSSAIVTLTLGPVDTFSADRGLQLINKGTSLLEAEVRFRQFPKS